MTIVYTTIFGGSDSLKPAPTGADRCVCFTDVRRAQTKGWDMVRHTAVDPRRTAWHLRCVPHDLFPAYDRVVWIDASFTLTNLPKLLADSGTATIAALRHHERDAYDWEGRRLVRNGQANPDDIEAQIAAYQQAKFVATHLSIACILVRDHSEAARRFSETWGQEIRKWPGDNTQVSLDYSAWVHGLTIRGLKGTRHNNPYAQHDHIDHRQRRRPYQPAEATA